MEISPKFPDDPDTDHKRPQNYIEKKDGQNQGRRRTGSNHAYDEKPQKSEDRPQKKKGE
jgi:hypothetical protein